MSGQLPQRGRFEGAIQIARYNWPFYAASVASLAAGWPLAERGPRVLRPLLRSMLALGAFWTVASLLVSHWVYDLSPLYRWQWIRDVFPTPPRHWVNIHAGLDESSLALRQLFPNSQNLTLDIYDAQQMTEASIERAREYSVPPVATVAAEYSALPLEDESQDAVFLLFAAHELRQATAREQFFRELRRVLRAGGRVLLVEHARDAANFVAFGPGFWHFLPVNEWRRLAEDSGFRQEREFSMTPLVRIWVLQKAE